MSNHNSITGGCACGSIRYRIEGEPILAVKCHCRECQRASGGGYAAVLVAWKADFELELGEPAYYAIDSENPYYLHRGFCSDCGSPVIMKRPERPKLAYVYAGSLDTPEHYSPTMEIFTEEAHSWDRMDDELDKFAGMPPVPDDFGR